MYEETKSDAVFMSLLRRAEDAGVSSIKGVIAGILGIMNDPGSSPLDLKAMIETDPPLAARVLKVANSPYYGAPRSMAAIDEAVIWIGFEALQEIVLTQKFSEIFTANGREVAGLTRPQLWRHSLAVALLAKLIYRWEFGEKGANAYAAGLLHDFGFILLDQLLHDDFAAIVQMAKKKGTDVSALEQDRLGFDHARVGGALAELWRFPPELVTAIAHHHKPQNASAEHARLAQVLFVADCLAFQAGFGYGSGVATDTGKCQRLCAGFRFSDYAIGRMVAQMRQDLDAMEAKGGCR